jgi:hypothetical protein
VEGGVMDIVERLRHHKSSDVWTERKDRTWYETDDLCMEAADEIDKLREENRMYWTRYWNMAQAFERRGNALHRIASMRSDPEFGVPPIMTVQKIAQEALLKEKD